MGGVEQKKKWLETEASERDKGVGLWVRPSLFNHSCSPNARFCERTSESGLVACCLQSNPWCKNLLVWFKPAWFGQPVVLSSHYLPFRPDFKVRFAGFWRVFRTRINFREILAVTGAC